nr:MAG TPA: hypothetical protein [Caudoviricetes sp.]DAJ70887.1 MAG TPA: hypothetical protein [Caudoviricetes sp.]
MWSAPTMQQVLGLRGEPMTPQCIQPTNEQHSLQSN